MAPSMQTPAQSMLRRPAASAAVMACAASATSDSAYRTISPGGRFCIATSKASAKRDSQAYAAGSLLNRLELSTGGRGGRSGNRWNPGTMNGLRRLSKGLTEEPFMANERIPEDPYRSTFARDELRNPAVLDNELQPDP